MRIQIVNHRMPWAIVDSATFRNPAILAPAT